MGRNLPVVACLGLAFAFAAEARADHHEEAASSGAESTTQYPDLEVTTWRPQGISFTIGGGVAGYTDTAIADRIDELGTAFEIRGVFGTTSYASIEFAHFGTVQRFELDVVEDARLLGLGLETAARLNFTRGQAFQPFVLAGIGWTHLNLLGQEGQLAGEDDRKNLAHLPIGAGVALYFGEFVFDARGQLRLTAEKEAKLFSDIDDGSLSTWAVTAQLGWHPR